MKQKILAAFTAALLLTGCDLAPVGSTVPDWSSLPEEPSGFSETMEPETEAETLSTAEQLLQSMTLDEKICQLFIVTPEQLTGMGQVTAAGEMTRDAILRYPVGGFIYFAQNLETPEQTREMLTNTQTYAAEAAGIGMFLAVDEEGGMVARAADKLGTTAFSDMEVYGRDNDRQQAVHIGSTIAADISGFGFNLDFAPVADVNIDSENELGSRIFSDDPAVVANMVSGVVEGLQAGGVAAALKHFPGLGAESGDTHEDGTVIIDRSLEQLRETEFTAFAGGIGAGVDFVMMGHQIVTGLGDDLPADLSPAAAALLREELGFEGLIITDSHQMNTITANYTSGEAAVMALSAGVDIVLIPDDFEDALAGVQEAVQSGTLTRERIDASVLRILKEKEKLGLLPDTE